MKKTLITLAILSGLLVSSPALSQTVTNISPFFLSGSEIIPKNSSNTLVIAKFKLASTTTPGFVLKTDSLGNAYWGAANSTTEVDPIWTADKPNYLLTSNFGTPFYNFFSATNTSALAEGSNLYWTDTRFDNRLSATSSVSGITTLPNLSLPFGQISGFPSSGVAQLGQIGDVSTSSPMTYGEILRYNTANSKWESVATSTLGIPSGVGKLALDQTTPETIINGRPIFSQGLNLGTTPTVGIFSTGKLFYDATYKTLSADIDGDVTLQIGQEEHILAQNNTGSQIDNGKAVYFLSAASGFPTIALAKADVFSTSIVTGISTQNIGTGTTGLVTRRGEIHNIDTTGTPYSETWNVGDVLYLSATTAGALTNITPSGSSIESRVGRVLEVNATTGEIYVDLFRTERLTDLADVTVGIPALDQVLRYNGTEWVNGASVSSSASVGIEFFNATPVINSRTSPAGLAQNGASGNGIQIASLSKTPVTTAEQTIVGQAVADTRAYVAWLYNTPLGRTSIDSGVWDFTTFAAVSSVAAGRVTTNTRQIYQVVPVSSGTVTITGAGANTRTATITSGQFTGTYFAPSATNTTASYLQTPNGLFQITTSGTTNTATITVPTGYSNESSVTFNVWNKLFGSTSSAITSTGTNYIQIDQATSQPAFTIATTDKLGQMGFVTSNNTTDLTVAYNGTTHSSHLSTPLITLHNNLAGLQGGAANEFYHLTLAEHTITTQAATASLNGYLSSTDFSTFFNKVSYTDNAVNSFISASSTIPKTYSNNTFTGTNNFTSTLGLSGLTNNGNATTTSLAITGLTGLLKGNGSTAPLSVASAGVDYENPLTFSYPLLRSVNAISSALATTTSNTWAGTQTFGNASTTLQTITNSTWVGENAGIYFTKGLSADGKYSGMLEDGIAGSALSFGDIVYLQASDSRWELADANLSAGYDKKVGIVVLAAAGDGSVTKIMLRGNIRADANFPTLTIGSPVYMAETAGDIVVTQPTTADVAIRIMGFANTADELYFNPSNDYMTHL